MAGQMLSQKCAEILAAGAPLQAVVASVLASQAGSSNLAEASRAACNLIATNKDFQHAVKNCHGLILAKIGPTSSEAAAAFAAVTQLVFGEWNTIASHHVLPPNTQALCVGSMVGTGCLLPLMQLRELVLHGNNVITPAAELRWLSSLTCLTNVDLTYTAGGDGVGAAADGWRFLQLRSLDIWPCSKVGQRLTRDTLLALSQLTGLWPLVLHDCDLDALQPAELGAVLGHLTSLQSLALENVRLKEQQQQQPQQQQPQQHFDSESSEEEEDLPSSSEEDDGSPSKAGKDSAQAPAAAAAAADSPLAVLLRSLAACTPRMQLTSLSTSFQRIDRAAAAALAGFVGLQDLQLADCVLEDCSLTDIVLGVQVSLSKLGVPGCRGVTDAGLPMLSRLLQLAALNLRGTGVTRQGRQRYLPQRLKPRACK